MKNSKIEDMLTRISNADDPDREAENCVKDLLSEDNMTNIKGGGVKVMSGTETLSRGTGGGSPLTAQGLLSMGSIVFYRLIDWVKIQEYRTRGEENLHKAMVALQRTLENNNNPKTANAKQVTAALDAAATQATKYGKPKIAEEINSYKTLLSFS